jgi:hypothetical protein
MKEAAYANLAIAVNNLGNLELTTIGPVYYGELEAVDQVTPPVAPAVGEKYAISYTGTATGAWVGKEGYIAECNQADPTVEWQFEQISVVDFSTVDPT